MLYNVSIGCLIQFDADSDDEAKSIVEKMTIDAIPEREFQWELSDQSDNCIELD
jgi:hypothetical protein